MLKFRSWLVAENHPEHICQALKDLQNLTIMYEIMQNSII